MNISLINKYTIESYPEQFAPIGKREPDRDKSKFDSHTK